MAFGLLDPGVIARGATPVDNPVDTMAGVLRVQQLRQQAAMAPLRMQQLQGDVEAQGIHNQQQQEQLRQQKEDVEADRTIQQTLSDNGGDWAKARPQLSGKVPNRVLLKRDADHLEYTRALTAANADQRKHVIETSTMLGQELNGIITAPEEQRQAAWEGAKTRLEQEGIIKAGAYPDQVPDLGVLKGYLGGTAYASTAAKAADAQAQEDQRRAMAKKTQEAAERADRLDRKNEFYQSLVSLGDDLDNPTYQRLRAAQKPDVQSSFPRELENPKTGRTREATIEQIRRGSMTAKDLTTADLTKQQRDLTQQQRDEQSKRDDEIARHNRAMEAIDSSRAAKERGETANARAVDRRQWERDVSKLKQEEETTAAIRSNLENAIKNGRTYVDEKGNTKTMKKASDDEATTAQDLVSRMRSQYEMLTNRQKRIVEDKNRFGEAMGMDITVPTSTIHGNLDRDLQRVKSFGQQPTTETPAAVPAATPQSAAAKTAPAAQKTRTVTEAQISAAAERNGRTLDEVRAALKAQGINVVK